MTGRDVKVLSARLMDTCWPGQRTGSTLQPTAAQRGSTLDSRIANSSR
jgi:hypothetical protein